MKNQVIVIHSNRYYDSNDVPFPPIGVIGEIVSDLDKYGEYDIIFENYPCPVGDDSWVTHKSMIVFINPPHENERFFEVVDELDAV